MDSNRRELVTKLLTLRSIVAALGETSNPPWWRTQFLGEASLRMMARIYPRTAIAAAINATSIASRSEHDRRVGTANRHHLFRLPSNIETSFLHSLSEKDVQASLRTAISGGRERLLAGLKDLQGNVRVRAIEGPVSMGLAERIADLRCLSQVAGYYHAAFSSGVQVFPYFDSVDG